MRNSIQLRTAFTNKAQKWWRTEVLGQFTIDEGRLYTIPHSEPGIASLTFNGCVQVPIL